MDGTITYLTGSSSIDWARLKAALTADQFDNGRSAEQLRLAFENSRVTAFALAGENIIGTARALSDGVSNAYVVDVWTHSAYRRQGIARRMMELLLEPLQGQHVYLFSDDATGFYTRLGFVAQPTGMGRVVGKWLQPDG